MQNSLLPISHHILLVKLSEASRQKQELDDTIKKNKSYYEKWLKLYEDSRLQKQTVAQQLKAAELYVSEKQKYISRSINRIRPRTGLPTPINGYCYHLFNNLSSGSSYAEQYQAILLGFMSILSNQKVSDIQKWRTFLHSHSDLSYENMQSVFYKQKYYLDLKEEIIDFLGSIVSSMRLMKEQFIKKQNTPWLIGDEFTARLVQMKNNQEMALCYGWIFLIFQLRTHYLNKQTCEELKAKRMQISQQKKKIPGLQKECKQLKTHTVHYVQKLSRLEQQQSALAERIISIKTKLQSPAVE